MTAALRGMLPAEPAAGFNAQPLQSSVGAVHVAVRQGPCLWFVSYPPCRYFAKIERLQDKLRCTIGTPDENSKFLDALKKMK